MMVQSNEVDNFRNSLEQDSCTFKRLKEFAPTCLIEMLKQLNEQTNGAGKPKVVEVLKGLLDENEKKIEQSNEDRSYDCYFIYACRTILALNDAFNAYYNKKDVESASWNNEALPAVKYLTNACSCLNLKGDVWNEITVEKTTERSERTWSSSSVIEDFDGLLRRAWESYASKESESKFNQGYKIRYILAVTSSLFRTVVPDASDNKRKEYRINALTTKSNNGKQEEGVVWNLFASKSDDFGWGMILPDPRSIFIEFDSNFFEGIKQTNELLRKNNIQRENVDVFWRLDSDFLSYALSNKQDFKIAGPSMGACFYTLIRTILENDNKSY